MCERVEPAVRGAAELLEHLEGVDAAGDHRLGLAVAGDEPVARSHARRPARPRWPPGPAPTGTPRARPAWPGARPAGRRARAIVIVRYRSRRRSASRSTAKPGTSVRAPSSSRMCSSSGDGSRALQSSAGSAGCGRCIRSGSTVMGRLLGEVVCNRSSVIVPRLRPGCRRLCKNRDGLTTRAEKRWHDVSDGPRDGDRGWTVRQAPRRDRPPDDRGPRRRRPHLDDRARRARRRLTGERLHPLRTAPRRRRHRRLRRPREPGPPRHPPRRPRHHHRRATLVASPPRRDARHARSRLLRPHHRRVRHGHPRQSPRRQKPSATSSW